MMFSQVRRPTPRVTRPQHLWQLLCAALITCASLFVPASSLVRAQADGPSVRLAKALVSPIGRVPAAGDTIVFDITVTNNGSTLLTTVPLSDTFDLAILQFAGATLAVGGAPAVPAPPDIVQPNLVGWNDLTTLAGDLAVGASFTLQTSFIALKETQPGGEWGTVVVSGAPASQPPTGPDGFPSTPNEFYDLETKFVIDFAIDQSAGGIRLAVKANGEPWGLIPDSIYGFRPNFFSGGAKHPGGQGQCVEYFIREYQRLSDTGRTVTTATQGVQRADDMLRWAKNCADTAIDRLVVGKGPNVAEQPAPPACDVDPGAATRKDNSGAGGSTCVYFWGFYDAANPTLKYWYPVGETANYVNPPSHHLTDSFMAWSWAQLAQTLQRRGDPSYTRYRDAARDFWNWASTVAGPPKNAGAVVYSARDRFWANLGTTLSYIYEAENNTLDADALRAESVACVNQTPGPGYDYSANPHMRGRCNGESYSSAYGRAPTSVQEQLRGRDHYVGGKTTWHNYGADDKFTRDPADPINPQKAFAHGSGREFVAGVQRAHWFHYSYPNSPDPADLLTAKPITVTGSWDLDSWTRYAILGYWKYARDKMWDNAAGQQAWWESSSYLYKPCFSLGTPLPIADWKPPTIGNKIHTLNPDGSATVSVSGVQDGTFPYLGWQFRGIGVRDVKVFYRYESDLNPNNWVALPAAAATPGNYTATIPASPNGPDTVFYYAEAADEFGNRSTFPSGGGTSGTYQIYTTKNATYNVAWVDGASDGTQRTPPTQTEVSTTITP
ncbi:MAG: hypothetical protein H7Y32_03055, partial [Chloroflexales bacterium]|nr:hypothetical protein [Chloroflexales bacterium]